MIDKKLKFEVAFRNSLALRFIVLVVMFLALTMSAASYFNYKNQHDQLVRQLITKGEMLGKFVSLVSPDAILGYDVLLLERYMQEIANREDVLYAAIVAPNGNGLAGYFDSNYIPKKLKAESKLSITEKLSLFDDQSLVLTLSFPINVDGELLGIIHIGLTKARIENEARAVFLSHIYQTFATIIALSLGIFYVFKRRVLNPIVNIKAAIQRISLGHFDYQIGATSKDELGVLARGFDAMSEYLKLSYDELQEKNQELLAATKAKSYFLANMSHEIRTPLTAIVGFSESLLDSELTNANRLAAINTIIRNGNYLQKIINDILDISKIEADKLEVEIREIETFDLISDVCDLVGLQAKEKGLEFHINFEYPIPATIHTDGLRLKQILVNLCSNAIKFTERGSIYVDVGFSRVNSQLVVSVADTGIGLTEDQMERIFKPFTQADSSTTRKFGGTGLGLTLTRQLTEMLGGSISVKSDYGKGSRFTITIAAGQIDSEAMIYSDAKITKSTNSVLEQVDARNIKGNLLVVDDNPDNQRLIKFFLSNTQLHIYSAFNGMEAIRAVEGHHFDIILMDMQMPVMDGLEAIEKIRNKGFIGPIISISADELPQSEEKARMAGCCEVLKKPIDKRKLVSYLYHHLVKILTPNKPLQVQYRGRVLLAEDTPDNQRLIQLMFEKWGVTLTVVENGQEAVQAALANDYDLILMDMQMPVMGGVEATQKIIEGGCKTPIVALTANALKHDRETYDNIGCAGFIAKPIKRDVFEKVLAKFLHQEQVAKEAEPFKIVRRNSLPEDDKVTPANIQTQQQLTEIVSNALQLSARPEETRLPLSQHEEDDSAIDELRSTELQSLGLALNQLAKVMDHPLLRQFMRQIEIKNGVEPSHSWAQSRNETEIDQPLYSSILSQEPDMVDMVRKYVSNLAKTQDELNQALAQRHWDKVIQIVHDIKGTGTAFGFPELSAIARDMDNILKSRQYNAVEKIAQDLNVTYNRILAARF